MLLPLVLVLLAMLMATVLAMTRYSAGTRHLFAHYERGQRCRDAAASAITEARRAVTRALDRAPGSLASFWKSLLPPYTGPEAGPVEVAAEATSVAFGSRLRVSPVTIRCLDRRILRGRAQGLLSLTVDVDGAGKDGPRVTRQEWVRYLVFRAPGRSLRILIVPGYCCVQVKG